MSTKFKANLGSLETLNWLLHFDPFETKTKTLIRFKLNCVKNMYMIFLVLISFHMCLTGKKVKKIKPK